jgi:hypothetical protein
MTCVAYHGRVILACMNCGLRRRLFIARMLCVLVPIMLVLTLMSQLKHICLIEP